MRIRDLNSEGIRMVENSILRQPSATDMPDK
jgi:hypothetical protein